MWAPDVIDPPPPFMMRTDSPIELTRFQTWRSKEPETIAWIDSFTDGDVFFDIGANVGVYSLYCAAVHPACIIVACEPDWRNYGRFTENILDNGFRNVTALHLGISDHDGEATFYEPGAVVGQSGGQLNAALCNGMAAYRVGVRSVDSLADEFHCPQHIKIDIDGQELRVVRGMAQTLRNPALKSVLIEVDMVRNDIGPAYLVEAKSEIVVPFLAAGFTIDNAFNTMSPHSRERRKADAILVENVVFERR